MKKIFTLIFLAAISMSGFAQQAELKRNKKPVQDYVNKRVFHTTKNLSVQTTPVMTYTQLSFKPYSEWLSEIERKQGLGILTPEEVATKKSALPPGGTLKIETRRKTIEHSDSKNFTVIIQDMSGNEVQRITCPPTQGRLVAESMNLPKHYSTLIELRIESPLNGSEFNVFIQDDALNLKFEYVIKND